MIELYCDFNGNMAENFGPLNRKGTIDDLKKLNLNIDDLIGCECVFYMDDADENGNLDDIMINGIVTIDGVCYGQAINCYEL